MEEKSRKTWNYENLKNYFEEMGCELLGGEEEFKDTSSYVDYRCTCGNIWNTQVANFIHANHRCGKCRGTRASETKRTPYDVIEEFCNKQGCVLLETCLVFVKSGKVRQTQIRYICSCGRESVTMWHNFKRCGHCRFCGYVSAAEKRRKKK